MLLLLTTLLNNPSRSVIVCCCCSFKTSLCIGNNNRRCEHTRTVIHKTRKYETRFILLDNIISIRRVAQKINEKKKKEIEWERERESSNSLLQQCSDVFWLHMRKERTHESLSRFFFFFFFPLPFFSLLLSVPSIYQKVWFDGRVLFLLLLFFSLCCFLFVRARQRREL